jgi:Flp pilus assembly protein TadD
LREVWRTSLSIVVTVALALTCAALPAYAGDIRISVPKRSRLTPVQRLNREGVEAVRKHKYEEAQKFFYRAYLYDPDDPFTLNNLGYVSELEGDAERAHQFYELAQQHTTEAQIDMASSERLKGQSVSEAASVVRDVPVRVNRDNVEAVRLLSSGRATEADSLLQEALTLAPSNAFTLNNLGVAKEMEGDYEGALKYYGAAAGSQSHDPVVVTVDKAWRGKPVSEMAAESVKKMHARMRDESAEMRVARLNLQGVSALNHNNRKQASDAFRQAYALDPENAFSLNNLGYLAELQGDKETAQFFYDKAENAQRADSRVGLATRRAVEGMRLGEVANGNQDKVENQITEQRVARSRERGPIQLKRRDGTPVVPAPPAENQTPQAQPNPAPQEQPPSQVGPPQPQIPQLTPQN